MYFEQGKYDECREECEKAISVAREHGGGFKWLLSKEKLHSREAAIHHCISELRNLLYSRNM